VKEGERCKVRRRGKVLRKGSAHRDNRVINGENDDLLCSFLSLESRDGLRLKETIKTSVLQSLIPSICCSSSSSSLRFSLPDILDLHYSHLFFIYYKLYPQARREPEKGQDEANDDECGNEGEEFGR
jgi:hypothetical protein